MASKPNSSAKKVVVKQPKGDVRISGTFYFVSAKTAAKKVAAKKVAAKKTARKKPAKKST